MGNEQNISIEKLLKLFNPTEEPNKQYDKIWFKNQIWILNTSLNDYKIDQLRKAFEFFDEKLEGVLDVANFKTVLMRNELNLSV